MVWAKPEDKANTHVLQEDLQDTTSLLVDETRDTLDTTTTSETTNGLKNSILHVSPAEHSVIGHSQMTMLIVTRTGLVIPWMLSRRILR